MNITRGFGGHSVLVGRGVAVTRDETSSGILTRQLENRGAIVHHWPTIAQKSLDDSEPLLDAVSRIKEFDWIVFSSWRSVSEIVSRVGELPQGVQVAAVGERTASSLLQAGWPVHAIPEVYDGKHVVHRLKDVGVGKGTRVLFPAGNLARDTIPNGLKEMGATVERVAAYEIKFARLDAGMVKSAIQSGDVQAVTFASSGTVTSFAESVGKEEIVEILDKVVVAVIGQSTRSTIEKLGIRKAFTAHPSTFTGLVEAVAGGFARKER